MKFKSESGEEWKACSSVTRDFGHGQFVLISKVPQPEPKPAPMPELQIWDRICGTDPKSGVFTAVISQVGSFYTSLVDVFDGARSELRSWDFVEKIHRNGKLIWERKA